MPAKEQELNRALRLTYGPALMNGPFAICVATADTLVGFTDRIKLRPLVAGEHNDRLYISSEEAAIRRIEPDIEGCPHAKGRRACDREGHRMSIGSVPLRFKVEIDPERCMKCGRCVENCSYGVFRKEGDNIVVANPRGMRCLPPLSCLLPPRCDQHL